MLNIKTFTCNPLSENTYVVSDETQECVIIDCGTYYDEERKAITRYIDDNQFKPVHLLATHGHFDHNFGIDTIFGKYGLKVEISAADNYLISDLPKQFQDMIGTPLRRTFPPTGHFFDKGEKITFGSHTLSILETPGHTPGGVVFYCEAEHVAFTGDTLFRMSIGRTDFDGGSYTDMMASLKNVIAKLPAETVIYSGHGPVSTIAEELRYNPYLR
ncbi:MAG: MBL fold metallo-hydrolase [Prevotella sp.]|nr:MBL fold metallo-hydrolase [Prevotella sp.]